MSFTVRGVTQVQWGPDYILTLDSPDGTSLDADGKPHPLVAKLVKTSNGAPVSGRNIRLSTSPGGEVGDGSRKMTDSSGKVTFTVSDSSSETVDYTATLVMASGSPTPLTATESIQWGGGDAWWNVSGGAWGEPFALGSLTPGDAVFILKDNQDPALGVPIVGAMITIGTTPAGRVGDGVVAGPTDINGEVDLMAILNAESVTGGVSYVITAATGRTVGGPQSNVSIPGGNEIFWD